MTAAWPAELPPPTTTILIGGDPRTEWLAGVLERDAEGYIRTGGELACQGPAGAGPAHPGAASLRIQHTGRLRGRRVHVGSVKRVTTAVGDGCMVVRIVHDYFRDR